MGQSWNPPVKGQVSGGTRFTIQGRFLKPAFGRSGSLGWGVTLIAFLLIMPVAWTQAATRQLKIPDATIASGQNGKVLVTLESLGNENALGFSLSFDPAKLQFTGTVPGSASASASINVNSSQAASGKLGVALALPSGQTFASGTRSLLEVSFTALASTGTASIQFADQPIAREIIDESVNILTADYAGGVITLTGSGGSNQPPGISVIPEQVINQGATGTVTFSINDNETPASALVLTVSSGNQTLLPNAGLNLTGSDASRTLQFTAAADQTGVATIFVTVSDGVLSTTSSFQVTVLAVENEPPTISAIPDQSLESGATSPAISFTVSDAETSAANLVVSVASADAALLPDENLNLGGTGTNRTLTIHAPAGKTGLTLVTVSVRDAGESTATRQFTVNIIAPNTPPSITAFADLISVDGAMVEAAFSVADAESPATSLKVTAASSAPTIISTNGIHFTGTGGNRTVTLTPNTNQLGSARITLTVTDEGGLTATNSFLLTVKSNTPPTISPIANQTVTAGISSPAIAFVIGDSETPAGQLSLKASSSLTSLVPLNGIVFGGSSSNRTVSISPTSNQSGSSVITITVTDPQNASATSAFTVIVQAVNAPPEITRINDITTSEDTPTAIVSFLIADAETPASQLTLTAFAANTNLVSESGFIFGGEGNNRTLKIIPATNQFGSSTITVAVHDGAASSNTNFVLTVLAVNDAPTISTIATQRIIAGTMTASIPFSFNDPETPVAELVKTLTVTSSNEALVELAGIMISISPGGDYSVRVWPREGQTGTAIITLKVTDPEGLNAASSFEVLVDPAPNVPPSILLISPLNNAAFTTPATVQLEAAASDADGQVARVEFIVNGSVLATVTAPPYRYSWTNVATGSYQISAVATDDLGATNSTASIGIQVTKSTPSNDNFAERARLTGSLVSVTATNLNATHEPGEPDHAGKPGGSSLWWSWIAPGSGPVTVDTLGSTIDTLLAVYSGSVLTNLTEVASNDDDPDGGSTSRLSFNAVAGTEYEIAVDAFGGEMGTVQLALKGAEPAGPPIKLETSGKNIVLSWPVEAAGYVVEASDSLTPNGWAALGQNPVVAGGQYSLKINAATGIRFFRLRRQ